MGVHVAFLAERVGPTTEQITSLARGEPSDPCWGDPRDRLLLRAADGLHDTSDIDDELWDHLHAVFTDAQLLDLIMLCGWYHAVSFTANGSRIPLDDGAPRFTDIAAGAPATPTTDEGAP